MVIINRASIPLFEPEQVKIIFDTAEEAQAYIKGYAAATRAKQTILRDINKWPIDNVHNR